LKNIQEPCHTFISAQEAADEKNFLESGYLIEPVKEMERLRLIRNTTAEIVGRYLDHSYDDANELLNNVHRYVTNKELNDLRLHTIQQINNTDWLRPAYFHIFQSRLETLVGNELAMQNSVNLSIQLPMDDSSLLPIHADTWSGNSPFEVVAWLPLVDCYKTKSMFILPPDRTKELYANFSELSGSTSEDLFKEMEADLIWIDINYGELLIFNQTLPHGNRINTENETRFSMNSRFKSVFSPYGAKELGAFFEPITLKAATRIGMNFEFPNIKSKSVL
tara:strand:+ start:4897 stop:5730 length:834 start_codon:yes stop_codon:yes gene_type:complete